MVSGELSYHPADPAYLGIYRARAPGLDHSSDWPPDSSALTLYANNFGKEAIATTADTGTMAVTQIVQNVTTIVNEAVKWITSYVGAITSNPLILTFVLLLIVGMGVGLIRRLVRV